MATSKIPSPNLINNYTSQVTGKLGGVTFNANQVYRNGVFVFLHFNFTGAWTAHNTYTLCTLPSEVRHTQNIPFSWDVPQFDGIDGRSQCHVKVYKNGEIKITPSASVEAGIGFDLVYMII